jgi:fermentation-respiration switch protein FrsA (DUF1100 family)
MAAVWIAQERLLFYPQPPPAATRAPAGWRLEPIRHTAADGTVLAGVLALPPLERAPLLVYYGGNAEEVTSMAPLAAEAYGDRAVLLVNYRGYGASGGKPGERALVADAVEILDAVSRRPDIDATRIALHGRSLGTGVAVQVAAARPARCVLLTSPFASARDVAQEIYPWLPVGLLMRHPFDSAAHAPRLTMPALILMGEADDLIPRRHSERLASLWAGPVQREAFAGFGHNDVSLNPRYAAAVRAFLERCH